MARPLRIQYPGAYYHLTCRGNDRKRIFGDDKDSGIFGVFGVIYLVYLCIWGQISTYICIFGVIYLGSNLDIGQFTTQPIDFS